jgi:hypothetical protein
VRGQQDLLERHDPVVVRQLLTAVVGGLRSAKLSFDPQHRIRQRLRTVRITFSLATHHRQIGIACQPGLGDADREVGREHLAGPARQPPAAQPSGAG